MQVFIFLSAAILLALAPPARAEDFSNRDLLRAFAGVSLGAEYKKRKPRILKWVKPVNVAIIGKGYPPLFEKLVIDHLADLREATGHPIKLVYSEVMRREKRLAPNVSKIPINMLIFFGTKKDLPALVEKRTNGLFKQAETAKWVRAGLCHGRIRSSKKTGALTFTYAAVPAEMVTRVQYGTKRVDPRILLRACVVEEITQMMGLPNDIKEYDFTIFSDVSPHVDLTEADRWMLKMLYDERMKSGMGPREALSVAVEVLRESRPGK